MHNFLLVASAFLASSVEMVEALTIVLAVAVTRGWRAAAWGVAAALGALTVIVAALGPAIAKVPIDSLRVVIGAILLVFGLQWLRKAVLRASGLKALHDEDAIFQAEVAALEADEAQAGGRGRPTTGTRSPSRSRACSSRGSRSRSSSSRSAARNTTSDWRRWERRPRSSWCSASA